MKHLDLDFEDWKAIIEGDFKEGPFIKVYSVKRGDLENIIIFPALIAESVVKRSLRTIDWDLEFGAGEPSVVIYYEGSKKRWRYHRIIKKGVEPLVHLRYFHGIERDYVEFAEEFRLYFNLYEDKERNRFYRLTEEGDTEEVIRIDKDYVDVHIKYLKEFLAVKKMRLVLCIIVDRESENTLEELGLEERDEKKEAEDFIYSICIRDLHHIDVNTYGRFQGKKFIKGFEKYDPSAEEQEKTYEEFIIGVDENGCSIEFTCDENKLADFFGKNPDSPNYLTPVYFDRNVLGKYYHNAGKYTVGDGYIKCGGLWSLRVDNNHPDYVVVYLGDLGHLSYKEQIYWKSFNLGTGAGISRTAFKRNFDVEFAAPDDPVLFFKDKYSEVNERWFKIFGWYLFLPLAEDDQHYYDTLRIPLNESQAEFDSQILTLAKILIDSLNERELVDKTPKAEILEGSINKLEHYLRSENFRCVDMFTFLRDLQKLRSSGSAHRKGANYVRIKRRFKMSEEGRRLVFREIVIECIKILNTLERRYLSPENGF